MSLHPEQLERDVAVRPFARDPQYNDLPPALSAWGSSAVAYLGYKDNLNRFGHDRTGYIAYRQFSGVSFALGDPIAPEQNWDELTTRFIAEQKEPLFIQSSEKFARLLVEHRMHVTPFGIETTLMHPFDLSGKRAREVRNLLNQGRRRRIVVLEIDNGDLEKALPINDHHLGSDRFKHGLSFLAQSDYDRHDPRIRWFAGYCDDKLIGLSLFYPMLRGNEIIGYAEILPYQVEKAPKGTRVTILLSALSSFASEGIYSINLGLSPFRIREQALFSDSNLSRLFLRTYRNGNLFFNFSGLGFHKSRYNGTEQDVYFASRKKIPIVELMKLYRLASGAWLPPLRRRR